MIAKLTALLSVGILLCGSSSCVCARAPEARSMDASDVSASVLQNELTALTRDFEGDVGIYVRRLDSKKVVALRADETFPTASLVKVPILLGLFDKLERGELEYRKPLTYEVKRKYEGEDILAAFQDGAKIPVAELATLMCTFSDNTASLWLQELAGGGATINAWLAAHGYASTRVNSRTEDRKDAQKEFGWGQTTPREMAELVVAIHDGRAVSPAASEEMTRLLGRSYWTGEALSPIPPHVHALSKQGAVNRSRSEVVLVDAPHGAYVFCVITKNQKDESWDHANAGFQLLRDASRVIWNHFEPDSKWSPAAGAERYF